MQALEDAPTSVERRLAKATIAPLKDYNDCQTPIGPQRLVEIYLHSVFFTRRLLKTYARVCICLAVSTAALATASLYVAAMELDRGLVWSIVLEVIFTVSIATVVVQLANEAAAALGGSAAMADIERRLETFDVGKRALSDLLFITRDYDAEHVAAPLIPSRLYHWRARTLRAQWLERRAAWVKDQHLLGPAVGFNVDSDSKSARSSPGPLVP